MRSVPWLRRSRPHPAELRLQRQAIRRQHQLNIAAVEHQLVLFLVASLLPVLVLPAFGLIRRWALPRQRRL